MDNFENPWANYNEYLVKILDYEQGAREILLQLAEGGGGDFSETVVLQLAECLTIADFEQTTIPFLRSQEKRHGVRNILHEMIERCILALQDPCCAEVIARMDAIVGQCNAVLDLAKETCGSKTRSDF